jgi:hypothetical protein
MLIDFAVFSFFAIGLGIAIVKAFERGSDRSSQRDIRSSAAPLNSAGRSSDLP